MRTMRTIFRFAILPFVAACLVGVTGREAHAQAAAGRPMRIVVAFPAGGPTDLLARVVAQKATEGLAQPVIVENRAGAGGNVGVEAVAKSPADGHTVLLATISFVINPSLYKRTGYDAVKDFAPITLLSSTPYVMLVHPSVPARSVKELIGMAKAKPGALNYASSGNGTAAHLAGELFKSAAQVDITHIPYKGAAPALTDLLAGQVSLLFNNPLTALPHVKTGKARALAVTSAKRLSAVPDLVTLAEAGVRGVEVGSWSAMLAPGGTPQAQVSRLHNEFMRVLNLPDVRNRLVAEGAEPIGAGPDELAAFIKSELAKWAKVVAQSGARLD
jgi:tripartite-type tricarboxylate transporter receptor subunit TctC